jgi:hypothetical protein
MFGQVNRFKMSNILITHLDGYFHASCSPFWLFLPPVQADSAVVNIFWAPVEDPCEPTDFAAVFDFPLAEQVQAGVLTVAAQSDAKDALALMVMAAAQPYEEELLALILMTAAPPCEEEVRALVLMAAGHHAVDARALVGAGVPGYPFADDPSRYDYTVLFLRHPSFHACTSHTCSNDDLHPMSASFCGGRDNVYGNIQTAHSKYIPAVSQ